MHNGNRPRAGKEAVMSAATVFNPYGPRTVVRPAKGGDDGGRRRGPQLRVAQLIEDLVNHRRIDGENRCFLEEYAAAAGVDQDWQRPQIPLEALARDLTVAVAGAGGYLTGATTMEPRELLRPFSVAARLGAEILPAGPADTLLPVQTSRPIITWLEGENAEGPASTPAMRSVAIRPKMAAAVIRFSRQLSKQSNAEDYARRTLLASAGIAIDTAALAGSGASGQPLGLLNTTQVPVVDGASFDYAAACEMLRTAAAADAADESLRWVAAPATRELLQQREVVTGSGRFIWDADAVLSRGAAVSTVVPSSALILGDWQHLAIRLWGGIAVEVSPFGLTTQSDSRSDFMAGQIGARVIVAVDVGLVHPTAFVRSGNVS
jgi:HK97 family phage major capsid protein